MLGEAIHRTKELTKFDKALVIANCFGFTPIRAPRVSKEDLELTKHCGNHQYFDAAEKVALLRYSQNQNLGSILSPIGLVYKKPSSRKNFDTHSLHFVGSSSGIAEATLICTALSILREEGYKNLTVDLNCVGDKESINNYERELSNHVRKSSNNLPEELKQNIKEDVFNIFRLETPEAIKLRENAPTSISFLSTQSRIYFKEVLEFIEALGIDFRLNPELVGEKSHVSHTIFAVKDVENETAHILAMGYRYPRLLRLLGLKKELPVAGITITRTTKLGHIYKELPKPKFSLIQLGREAKIKTLSLLELLRSHHIPVHHLLGMDKITTQLSSAESLRVSHLIIIGQKEALDNTATVRNILTRAQDTVSISDLPHYLKHIGL